MILRALLSAALLFGGVGIDWSLAGETAPVQACCCDMMPGAGHSCGCPTPSAPSQGPCGTRTSSTITLVAQVQRDPQATATTRNAEAHPAPGALVDARPGRVEDGLEPALRGRDPDLGRHLARLSLLRI